MTVCGVNCFVNSTIRDGESIVSVLARLSRSFEAKLLPFSIAEQNLTNLTFFDDFKRV